MPPPPDDDAGLTPLKRALIAVRELKDRVAELEARGGSAARAPVAVVGLGARFPGGAVGPEGFWRVLRDAVDVTGEVPASRWDAAAWEREGLGPSRGAFLPDVARFDAGFFGIAAREAVEMDPVQRLLLEVAWEALEDAGIPAAGLTGSRTGVYLGLGLSDYARRHFLGSDPGRLTPWSGTGSFLSVAAGRVAYALGLTGPAMAVDTACSSSLVAAHLAVGALRTGEAELALVAGANLLLSPMPTAYFTRLQALSPDGRCKTFDARADGYGRGEGVGVLVLKRLDAALADGDRIHAVIRGSAVNQDGRSNGLTAPSGLAQQAVIRAALADAGLTPADIGAVEAHGTGTPLGDPIEVDALRAVFGGQAALRLGSVKANLGHTETAAGVAGLIKASLSVSRGELPAHPDLRELNPRIRLDDVGFEVVTSHQAWPDGLPRRMGVSGFGLAGTNAHLIVEAPPTAAPAPDVEGPHLLVLSARSEAALAQLADRTAATLDGAALADASAALFHGRSPLPWRLAVAAHGPEDAARRLRGAARRQADLPKVAWLFTGQGAQWPSMGADLYRAGGVFREVVDRVLAVVDVPLREVWLGGQSRIHDTAFTQIATYALQVGLAARFTELGVEPAGMLGHSVGEFAAAQVAGVFSVEDGARLVAARGRLMGALPAGGAMAAVFVAPAALGPLPAGVELAAVNHPGQVVLTGDEDALHALLERLRAQGVESRPLTVSHAFHSARMDPMLARFRDVVASVRMEAPRGRLVSALDGELLGRRALDPDTWIRQAREPVRFMDGLLALSDCGLFLELGPAGVLCASGARTLPEARFVPTLSPPVVGSGPDGPREVLEAVGALWAAGVPVVGPARRPVRPALPTMAWQGEAHWLEVPVGPSQSVDALYRVRWVVEAAPRPVTLRGTWWVLAHDATDVERALRAQGARVVRVIPGGEFAHDGDEVRVDPGDRAHFEWLVGHLGPPDGVVVLWGLGEPVRGRDGLLGALFAAGVTGAPVSAVVSADRPSGLPGLMRVLRSEHPGRAGALVHVGEDVSAERILAEIGNRTPEVLLDDARRVPRLRSAPSGEPPPMGRTVWITGGSGDLGLQLARRLAGSVDALVLISRSGVAERELVRMGPHVRSVQGDVTDNLVPLAAEVPPDLVFHLAGARVDGLTDTLGADDLEAALHARVDGAWRLNEVAPDAELVLVGSAAALLGNPGQGAYAAANAWLEGFARWRTAQGAPTWCLAPGPVAGTAMAADVLERLAGMGARALSVREALDLVLAVRGSPEPVVLAAPFDWERWAAAVPSGLLGDLVRGAPVSAPVQDVAAAVDAALIAALGGLPPADQGLFDAGMDSLMATELRARLEGALGRRLPASIAFDHPTRAALTAFLRGDAPARQVAVAPRTGGAVAIVGMACRLPGGVDGPDAFWELLASGRDGMRAIDRWDADALWSAQPATPGRHVTRHAALLDEITTFDADRFGISPREASRLDPQQRLLLEAAWDALEHGGHPPGSALADTGVYVGIGGSEYGRRFDPLDAEGEADPYAGTGNEGSFAAGRISHALGLQGPALAVNTACSSSLVAVHLAVRALREGACRMALAGGVNALVAPEVTVQLSQIRALSADGRCKAFDASADGYGRGEGVGMVLLKRLDDALADGDRVLAVIRGTAVNHDGRAAGLTVPSGSAQRAVIAAALADGGVDGADVGLLEAHGTGTRIGDPLEIEAARAVLMPGRPADRPLHVGSVKTNVGHLEAGAGVVGLIKATLALQHGAVPPTLNLTTPNPELDLDRIVLPTSLIPWDGRFAGVSSFGISGTNAHAVLERGPEAPAIRTEPRSRVLLVASGVSEAGLDTALAALPPEGSQALSRALGEARSHGSIRGFRVQPDGPEIAPASPVPGARAWLFTGQGAQWTGMGLDLAAQEPAFAEAFDACADVLRSHDLDLRAAIASDDLHHTRLAQPAVFALEWALAAWFRSRGFEPDVVMGHSLGEWTAAAVAGVVAWDDALRLVIRRGDLMGALPSGGATAAVFCAASRAREAIGDEPVDIAGLNGPEETVLSGEEAALERVLARLGLPHRRLLTSHAFHSRLMDPVLAGFEAEVAKVRFAVGRIPLISNLDGRPAGDRVLDPAHWARLIREPVHVEAGLRTLVERGVGVALELGPRPILVGMVRRNTAIRAIGTLGRDADGPTALHTAVGELWQAGDTPDWAALTGVSVPVPPPPHPFHRVRHWVERGERVSLPERWCWRVAWRPSAGVPGSVSGRVDGDGPLADALRGLIPDGADRIWVGDVAGALNSARAAVDAGVRWSAVDLGEGGVAGLARAFALEHPDRWGRLVHAGPGSPAEEVRAALALSGAEDEVRAGDLAVGRLEPGAVGELPPVRGAWLVTGASGAIGGAVVRRLLQLGASEVIALSRSGSAPEHARVRGLALDLTDPGAPKVLAGLAVRGVVHCAGLGRRVPLADESADGLQHVFGAKVHGARVLSAAFPALDAFLAVSSVAATWGSAGQVAYAAANAALEAIVAARTTGVNRAVALGPVRGGLTDPEGAAWLQARGLRAMSPALAAEAVLRVDGVCADVDWSVLGPALQARGPRSLLAELSPLAIRPSPSDVSPAPVDLAARVRRRAARVLGLDPASLDPAQGLFDAGMDSLTAVELARGLSEDLGRELSATLVFEHGSVQALVAHLQGVTSAGRSAGPERSTIPRSGAVAIVGMACRFPGGSDSPEAYWEFLRAEIDAVGPVPPSRWDPADLPDAPGEAAFVDGIDTFDPQFFGMSPREAASLDPQQRVLLEVSFEALDRAGLAGPELKGRSVGVFCGIPGSAYLDRFLRPDGRRYPDEHAGTGNESSFAAGRVAYALGVTGPAVSLNTACSSALVAVHLACEAVRAGDCELALAGGAALMVGPDDHAYLARLGALSADGRCRTFDADASGYGRGEGAGMVALARLEDAERLGLPILAVIEGSAVNHDGASSGLTVPNGSAQERVIRQALDRAGRSPDELGYLEAHGTGTRLGDPIEVRAVQRALDGRSEPIWMGAVKTRIGHLEQAAGVASLIKVVLQQQHGQLAPHLHLHSLNPEIPAGVARIPTTLTPWEGSRLAGISGFGLSGTNAHLIVAPAPERAAVTDRAPAPLFLSATGRRALDAMAVRLEPAVQASGEGAVAGALWRRARRPVRRVLREGRVVAEGAARRSPRLALLFTGQGSQRPGMLEAWRSEPAFLEAFERVVALADPHRSRPLSEVLETDAVHATENAQIALFAFTWAVASWWRAHGVEADAVAGHSVGELAAAAWAGMLPLERAVELVCARGRLMGSLPPGGAMAAVFAGEAAVRALLVDGAEVAGVNHPEETVISGGQAAVEAVLAALPEGVGHRRLTVSHAFHSAGMEPILAEFAEVAAQVPWTNGRIPLARGEVLSAEPPTPDAWARQIREPVRFLDVVRALEADGITTWLEVGPAPVLVGAVARTSARATVVTSARRDGGDVLDAAAALWVDGIEVALGDRLPVRGPLTVPPTAFARSRCWLDLPEVRASSPMDDAVLALTWPVRAGGRGPGSARIVEVPTPRDPPELERVLAGLLGTCQELLAARQDAVFVTTGASLLDDDPAAGALGAGVHGFLRAAAAEGVGLTLVDRSADVPLADALKAVGDEPWIAVRPDGRHVARLARAPMGPGSPTIRADRSWVVTGGMSGLGLEVAVWLAAAGAPEILLIGRTVRPDAAARVRAAGAIVRTASADVADPDALEAALGLLERRLGGVVHAAGVLDDGALVGLSAERVAAVLRPKVRGALALREAVREQELDVFAVFSSASAVMGSAGQASYGAANAALDGLVRAWRREGLPAVSLAWGPWADVGMAAGLAEAVRQAQRARGIRRVPVRDGLRLFGEALVVRPVQAIVLPMDWPAFAAAGGDRIASDLGADVRTARIVASDAGVRGVPADVPGWVEGIVRDVLRWPADRALDRDQPLGEVGMDSLMAVQVRNALGDGGVELPVARLLGGPSVDAIAAMVRAATVPQPSPAAETPIEPVFWLRPEVTHGLIALAALVVGAVLTWTALQLAAPPAPPGPDVDDPPPRSAQ